MKALTLYQPWASAIALGYKAWETRSFATRHRGPLAIHAGLGPSRADERRLARDLRDELAAKGAELPAFDDLPRGAVLCVVDVVEVLPAEDLLARARWGLPLRAFELDLGDFSAGRFAWRLRRRAVFASPRPARGRQGLWNWPGSAARGPNLAESG